MIPFHLQMSMGKRWAWVGPSFALISVGSDYRFGHPHEAVLERLGKAGDVTVLRTDEQGTVEFVTDGRQMWVRAEQ